MSGQYDGLVIPGEPGAGEWLHRAASKGNRGARAMHFVGWGECAFRGGHLVGFAGARRLRGNHHPCKYRMAVIDAGACVLRYDNEAGKGDHRHVGDREESYEFATIEPLLGDSEANIRSYLDGRPHHR